MTYKNIGQRTCHIDGSGSSEDFSLLGVEESIDHSKIHFMLCHVLGISLEFLAGGGEALILFFGLRTMGQEFLVLCCLRLLQHIDNFIIASPAPELFCPKPASHALGTNTADIASK